MEIILKYKKSTEIVGELYFLNSYFFFTKYGTVNEFWRKEMISFNDVCSTSI